MVEEVVDVADSVEAEEAGEGEVEVDLELVNPRSGLENVRSVRAADVIGKEVEEATKGKIGEGSEVEIGKVVVVMKGGSGVDSQVVEEVDSAEDAEVVVDVEDSVDVVTVETAEEEEAGATDTSPTSSTFAGLHFPYHHHLISHRSINIESKHFASIHCCTSEIDTPLPRANCLHYNRMIYTSRHPSIHAYLSLQAFYPISHLYSQCK